MPAELQFYGTLDQTGLTIVAKVYNNAGLQIGGDIPTNETANLAIYIGDMPNAVAGQYGIRFFNDLELLGQGSINWNGTNEIGINETKIDAIKINTDLIPATI